MTLVASTAAALIGCGSPAHQAVHRQCVDSNNVVVDERYCESPVAGAPTPYPYRWYYYGSDYYRHHTVYVPIPYGAVASGGSYSAPHASGAAGAATSRGIFGGTAEGAGAHGGGAGE